MPARRDPVDVVVVGAGMGGAAFCARLSERAPRLRIVCLERGGWVDTAAMPPWRRDWQRATIGDWASSPNLRLKAPTPSPSADYPIDDSATPFKPLMWSGVGGSTVNWAAHFPRLHPSDFKTRTLDGVGDDWPFGYADLEPYYDLNDAAMGVSGLAGDPAYPPKPPRAMPPLALGRLGMTAARGFDALGWHWWPVDAAINSVPHNGRAGLQLLRAVPAGLREPRQGLGRRHLLAAGDRQRRRAAPALHRPAGRDRGRPRHRRRLSRRRGPRGHRSRPPPSSSPATASARRACCWRPASPARRSAAT